MKLPVPGHGAGFFLITATAAACCTEYDGDNGDPLAMNHELTATGSEQDLNRLRAYLVRLEDLARHASPVDHFRLKYTIQRVNVAIEAVDNARQVTQRAVQQQLIAESMLMEVIAKNRETELLELHLKDTGTSK
jgi:hypothetical protein